MISAKTISLLIEDAQIQVKLPASKSISNRALVLNSLAYSPCEVENLSDCDDTVVMVKAFESDSNHFDVGAAGTSMRFLTAFLAKTVGEWTITGSERMKQRPIKLLVDALNSLGGKVEYLEKEGFPPLKIYGSALMGGEIHLNGGVSSQYISALMMIAPYMYNGLKIVLQGDVISRPYIMMTLRMMEEYGVKVSFEDNVIDVRPQAYNPVRYKVESDWSAASYWYEIVAIAEKGSIFMEGLNRNSLQGDSAVADIFEHLGVRTAFAENGVNIFYDKQLLKSRTPENPFEYNFVDVPDLAQAVVVACCLKGVPFHFSGLQSLKIKETNRIEALINELNKLGFRLVEPQHGQLAWSGARVLDRALVPSIATYDDHRMAMAFAPAGLLLPIEIQYPMVVTKSYPDFWTEIAKIESVGRLE